MAKINKNELPEEYRKIWDEMIMPVDTNIALSDVILSDENKEKIKRFIDEVHSRDKLAEYGLQYNNRALLYGASGTGKTFVTKALANTLGFTMLYIDISKALSEGNVAYNVSQIFKLANYLGDCIIFLDECDSVAWDRADGNNNDTASTRRATNSIFQNLDQMNPTNLFFAATNLVENLDFAFRRRFNYELEFKKPSLDIDEAVKHFIFPKFQIVDDVSKYDRDIIKRRAKGNPDLSYYEIQNIVEEGMKRAILKGSNIVHTKDIYKDLQEAMHFTLKEGNKLQRDDLPRAYRDIWDEVIMPVDTNISMSNVILSEENTFKIKQFIKEYEYREQLIEYGLEPQNRLLLYGASGTGKTFMSKALANHLNYTMLYVDIAKALSEGDVADKISKIFKLGNYIEKAVIFLDECDSVAWNRDGANTDGGVIRRATNSIFQNLDQMNSKCIFISATNMLHRLDPAFERRFNMKMRFKRPELDMDEAVKHFIYPKFIVNDDVDETVREIVKRRAKQNAKLSYYEIEEVVKRAMKDAILNDTNVVSTAFIYENLSRNMNFKVRFGTGDDPEEIFTNNLSYEPKD